MLPSNQPGGGLSPEVFARQRLMNAQANGLLPQNFNIAGTAQNVLGQFHQLAGALGGAKRQTNATSAHQLINSTIGGLNNGNNVMTRNLVGGGAGPHYGAFNARHPLAAPQGMQEPQHPTTLPLQVNDQQNSILSMLAGGQNIPGNDPGFGAQQDQQPADPRTRLLQQIFAHIMGRTG